MKTASAKEIISQAARLHYDRNGNARFYLPAKLFPFQPGSKTAQELGLRKYRGKDRAPGFVILGTGGLQLQAEWLAVAVASV